MAGSRSVAQMATSTTARKDRVPSRSRPGSGLWDRPARRLTKPLAAVDAFDAALRARDLIAAEAVWALNRADVSILGSASGEEFIGPDAVRACLAALTSRPTAHGWRWVDRQVSVVGDVAWLLADASWQTVHADGAVTERPSRVTGVLVRADGTWRWCQYHGSEPLGSTG